MGAESGGGGRRDASPAVQKSAGMSSQKRGYFSNFFLDTYDDNFALSNVFKIKWSKSEEKLNFGDRWAWVSLNPIPPHQNFLAATFVVAFDRGSNFRYFSLRSDITKSAISREKKSDVFSEKNMQMMLN